MAEKQLFEPRHGVTILPDLPKRPSVLPVAGLRAHFALRKKWGKTVMPQENSCPSVSGRGRSDTSPEKRQAVDELFSLTYEELRRLATSVKRGDQSNTLNPTALVNEAWLKLASSPGVATTSPLHFKRIAARAMRQLLVEAARRRNAGKRNGAAFPLVTFDESLHGAFTSNRELLGLNAALDELAELEPRQAAIVESRFFGGFEMAEIAKLLGISEATTLRDWRVAKAWLGHKLSKPS
jgi:RNA polymerase sigma factor (TIGR02999 family)